MLQRVFEQHILDLCFSFPLGRVTRVGAALGGLGSECDQGALCENSQINNKKYRVGEKQKNGHLWYSTIKFHTAFLHCLNLSSIPSTFFLKLFSLSIPLTSQSFSHLRSYNASTQPQVGSGTGLSRITQVLSLCSSGPSPQEVSSFKSSESPVSASGPYIQPHTPIHRRAL